MKLTIDKVTVEEKPQRTVFKDIPVGEWFREPRFTNVIYYKKTADMAVIFKNSVELMGNVNFMFHYPNLEVKLIKEVNIAYAE